MAARGIAQAARNAPQTQLAHSLAQHCGCRARAELLEEGERLALFLFGTVPAEQAGLLIGTPECLPHLRRGAPVTGNFQLVRLSDISWRLRKRLHPVQPYCELASHPWIPTLQSEFICRAHRLDHRVPITGQPRGLGVDCRDPADALQVGLRARQRARLCKRRTRIGVAAPKAQVR